MGVGNIQKMKWVEIHTANQKISFNHASARKYLYFPVIHSDLFIYNISLGACQFFIILESTKYQRIIKIPEITT